MQMTSHLLTCRGAPPRGGGVCLLRLESSLPCCCRSLDSLHCEPISHLIIFFLGRIGLQSTSKWASAEAYGSRS